MKKMLTLMERISSVLEDEEFQLEEPIYTMYSMWYLYEEAEAGIISMDSFRKAFEDFLLYKKEITTERVVGDNDITKIETLKYVKIEKILLIIYNVGCFFCVVHVFT